MQLDLSSFTNSGTWHALELYSSTGCRENHLTFLMGPFVTCYKFPLADITWPGSHDLEPGSQGKPVNSWCISFETECSFIEALLGGSMLPAPLKWQTYLFSQQIFIITRKQSSIPSSWGRYVTKVLEILSSCPFMGKGWPAVRLAVVPKIGISLSPFLLWKTEKDS